MRTITYRFSCLLFFIILFSSAFTAYLTFMPQTISQPDGTIIDCYSSGDEYFNWVHDKDGYTIIQSHDGFWYYAQKENNDLVASNFRVNEVDPNLTTLEKWIRISRESYLQIRSNYWEGLETRSTPTTGVVNNLNVFIRFADENEFGGEIDYYDAPFNLEEGPSMRHYFDEVSYNTLDVPTSHFPIPDGVNVISYQDQYPRNYYEPYNETTNPDGYTNDNQRTQREHILLKNSIDFISHEVSTDLDIDGDNDNLVDNVTFLVYGSPGAWADLLWPHRWVLYTQEAYINGARVWDYNFNLATGGYFTVGTLCHEFFHSLGAPDLYHYYDTGAPVACGGWDVMDGSNDPPQYMGAFMKAKYGHWIEDNNNDGISDENDIPIITEPGVYEINPLQESTNYIYRINSPYTNGEYFIVEYRKKEGMYDSNTPGYDEGLLVYRINTQVGDGNADGPPDEIYIYRPNGTNESNGNLGIAIFNEETGRDKINDQTNPTPFLTDGSEGGLYLKDIGNPNETISFRYQSAFLNAELHSITDDTDNDGILNPDEEAVLNFVINNISVDAFAYEIVGHLDDNDYLEILENDIVVDDLFSNETSELLSFPVQVKEGVELGEFALTLNITAMVSQGDLNFEYEDDVVNTFDISLRQAGFPYETTDQVLCSPAVYDIDGNGINEIIFADNAGTIYVLNSSTMDIFWTYNTGSQVWGAPSIADVDLDGNVEIIFTSKSNMIYCFHHLGSLEWSFDAEEFIMAAAAIGNLDNDAEKEIVFGTYPTNGEGDIYVLNHDGTQMTPFPMFIDERIQRGVALSDFDGNGKDDIVFGTDDENIYLLNDNSEIVWSFNAGGDFRSAPSILELLSGDKIIVVGSKDDNFYALNSDGSVRFIVETGNDPGSAALYDHPSYGPIIAFGSDDGNVYQVDIFGNNIPNWPVDTEGSIKGTPTVSDFNADGNPDIIVTNADGNIYIIEDDGNILPYYPIEHDYSFTSTASIADIDNDGDIELTVGMTNGVISIDHKDHDAELYPWSMYRGGYERRGFFVSESTLGVESDLSQPAVFRINNIYPNPFNPTTQISIDIPEPTDIVLSVFDISGKKVETLFNGWKASGTYGFTWNASSYASGIYVVKLESNNSNKYHKIMLVK